MRSGVKWRPFSRVGEPSKWPSWLPLEGQSVGAEAKGVVARGQRSRPGTGHSSDSILEQTGALGDLEQLLTVPRLASPI